MGTGSFAVPSLRALLGSGRQVIGVVTQPDRPSGRGRQISLSPVKEVAVEAGLPVYQPERVRSEDFIELVRQMAPDAIVVASFGQIIPKSILDIPKYGNINVHASLLPKYRGAAPVHYALFCGEPTTGVTTILMDAGLDTGAMLLQREVEIPPEDDKGSLEARLADVGAALLLETLEGIEQGTIIPKPQDNLWATIAPSVKREDCELHWSDDVRAVCGRVRGCSPRPGAYTHWQGSLLKIWSCRAIESASSGEVGEVIDIGSEGIVVQAGNGPVLITEVQPENKKRMHAGEFARGYRLSHGAKLG